MGTERADTLLPVTATATAAAAAAAAAATAATAAAVSGNQLQGDAAATAADKSGKGGTGSGSGSGDGGNRTDHRSPRTVSAVVSRTLRAWHQQLDAVTSTPPATSSLVFCLLFILAAAMTLTHSLYVPSHMRTLTASYVDSQRLLLDDGDANANNPVVISAANPLHSTLNDADDAVDAFNATAAATIVDFDLTDGDDAARTYTYTFTVARVYDDSWRSIVTAWPSFSSKKRNDSTESESDASSYCGARVAVASVGASLLLSLLVWAAVKLTLPIMAVPLPPAGATLFDHTVDHSDTALVDGGAEKREKRRRSSGRMWGIAADDDTDVDDDDTVLRFLVVGGLDGTGKVRRECS
jgi:hypothetical protein